MSGHVHTRMDSIEPSLLSVTKLYIEAEELVEMSRRQDLDRAKLAAIKNMVKERCHRLKVLMVRYDISEIPEGIIASVRDETRELRCARSRKNACRSRSPAPATAVVTNFEL